MTRPSNDRCKLTLAIGVAMFTIAAISTPAVGQEFAAPASWTPPTAAAVRAKVLDWVEQRGELDEATRIKVDALWPADGPDMSGVELLDNAAATFAVVDAGASEVVQFCRGRRSRFVPPEFSVLADEKTSPLVRDNLRLLVGRWLSQQQLYDESLAMLADVSAENVVDPASLFFYRSVAYHRLLDKEHCLPALAKLLENEDQIPRRYATVAKLMEADLKPLKTDSLDEIARLMDAVRLELEHARAGARVRERQADVIAKLDKLI
ncbi:MAG: hypothetical protein KDA41_05325, partial [Planctomycetales bacterium]|nr:hypothetical protein [Planctomycetales bacterium]